MDAVQIGEVDRTSWFHCCIAVGRDINKCHCIAKTWIENKNSGTVLDIWTKCEKEETVDSNFELLKVYTCPQNCTNKINFTSTPSNFPLTLLTASSIWFLVVESKAEEAAVNIVKNKKNAFNILMSSRVQMLSFKEQKNQKCNMFNDILKLANLKAPKQSLGNYHNLLHTVTECLWGIDGNQSRFTSVAVNGHCKILPTFFSNIYETEYRDWRRQKKPKPTLKQDILLKCSDDLFDRLSCLGNAEKALTNNNFFIACQELATSLRSYADYLKKAQVRTENNRTNDAEIIHEILNSPTAAVKIDELNSKYKAINNLMDDRELYDPVNVDGEFVPDDRRERYGWFKELQICHRIQIYKYNCGGSLGNLTFIWNIGDELDQKKQVDVVTEVRKMVPKFERALMAKQMREKYSAVTGLTPAVRRNLVQYLTGQIPKNKSDVDDLFELYTQIPFDEDEECQIVYDQRKTNEGRPEGNFSIFYKELDNLLEEFGKAAEERRKSDATHLPLAVSVPQLIRKVNKRLKTQGIQDAVTPSVTTLRYQFMPGFQNRHTQSRYSQRFDVIFKIQRRQIRKYHEDAHYVNAYFLNFKNWCVANREECILICMDDKAKVAVGEPGTPEAATGHNRKTLTKTNIIQESADHNYHVGNFTPSVSLICDIPESVSQSFYSGHVYVGIKDSIFEGSNSLRHIVELLTVMKRQLWGPPPYLCLFSDGGADHNVTFLYNQCALLALFKIGNFDILNVGRCAPSQSFINPAERAMSLLNIGLQGMALERDHAGPFEKLIGSCKTMKSLRTKADQQQGLKEAYSSCIEASRKILEKSFEYLELKGNPVQTFQPNEDYAEVVSALNSIEPIITNESTIPHSRARLKNYPSLRRYFQNHMTDGLYLLQFRKCDDPNCCTITIADLPPKVPAPILAPDKEHYLPFDLAYGKIVTTEKDCPSLQKVVGDKKKKNEPNYKYLAKRVVSVIKCHQCNKPRCVYSMNNSISPAGQRELEDVIFSCGMMLRSAGTLYMKKDLRCSISVENAFYATRSAEKFVCLHCGTNQIDNDSLKQLRKDFKIVFPVCTFCKSQGKKETCLNELKKAEKSNLAQVIEEDRPNRDADDEVDFDNNVNVTFQVDHNIDLVPGGSGRIQTKLTGWIKSDHNLKRNIVRHSASTASTSKIQKLDDDEEEEEEEEDEDEDEENSICSICQEPDPPGRKRNIIWKDCDVCSAWAHEVCAKTEWTNVRKDSWLCKEHC